jgi:hypothetical protein
VGSVVRELGKTAYPLKNIPIKIRVQTWSELRVGIYCREVSMPAPPGLKFIYLYNNDLQSMRHFYSQLLGLNENHCAAVNTIQTAAANGAAVPFDCDGLQFAIFVDPTFQERPFGKSG